MSVGSASFSDTPLPVLTDGVVQAPAPVLVAVAALLIVSDAGKGADGAFSAVMIVLFGIPAPVMKLPSHAIVGRA